MLCLVADNEREVGTDPIGRIVASRLRAAAKARGWSQGQVHYQANAGQPPGEEVISLTTVQALLRGAYVNPSLSSVLAVSRALDLTLDQVVGITPMPETVPAPPEDDVEARVRALLDERLRPIERALGNLGRFHLEEAEADEQAATALEQAAVAEQHAPASVSPLRRRRRKAK